MNLNPWILIAVFGFLSIPSAQASSRISADQIDAREGLVYEAGQPTPFTGIAYWQWPDGKVKTEREYREGRPTGLIRTYSANGKLEKETRGKPPVVTKPAPPPSKPVPSVSPTSPVSSVVFQAREGSSVSSAFPSFPSSGAGDPSSINSPGTLISRQGESIPIDLGATPVITEQPKHGQLRGDGGGK